MSKLSIRKRWRKWAKALKSEVYALYFACRDPRTPWYMKLLIAIVVGYALSPIDLIPDFIPILGYLDDLILIPLGVAVIIKMVPAPVMEEAREKAKSSKIRIKNWLAGMVIIIIWIMIVGWVLFRISKRNPII